MTLKISTGFKKLAMITVAISGFGIIPNWSASAGPSYQMLSDQEQAQQHRAVVAQNETRTTTKEKTAPSSESSASEPKTQEKKESAEDQEKLLKDFRPSERIEAEQAVDFPYDI
jgi:hypothetical protein